LKDTLFNRNALIFALFFSVGVSLFTSRILVPLVYYPFYMLLLIGLINKSVFKLNVNHVSLLATILLIFIFHLPYVKDFTSNFIYTCLWLVNILISALVYNMKSTVAIEKSLAYFGFSLIGTFVLLRLLGMHPSGFYGSLGFNINLVAFFVTFSIYYLFINVQGIKSRYVKYLLAALSLLTGSRMQLLMYFGYAAFQSKLALYLSLIFGVALGLYFLPSASIVFDVVSYFSTGQFSFSEKFDDTRRIYLAIAALESLKNTFPLGSGFGLENYVQFAGINIGDAYSGSVRLSMSHNFYLSYLALSGVFFIPLLVFLLRPIFNSVNEYKYLYMMFLIGIAFNEYITSPIFWVVHGLMLRKSFKR
jgi:hypothetical protein